MKQQIKQLSAFLLAFLLLTAIAPAVPAWAAPSKKDAAVTKVMLNYTQYVLKKGQKLKLKATLSPKAAKAKVTYKSGNPKAVSVTPKGVVTAKAAKGKATVTAFAGKKKAVCKITIGIPVTGISASDVSLAVGHSAPIRASVQPQNASVTKLVYQSSSPSVAKVDENGNVTGLAEGTSAITILAADCLKVKKTIRVNVTKAGGTNPAPNPEPGPNPNPTPDPNPAPDPNPTPNPDQPQNVNWIRDIHDPDNAGFAHDYNITAGMNPDIGRDLIITTDEGVEVVSREYRTDAKEGEWKYGDNVDLVLHLEKKETNESGIYKVSYKPFGADQVFLTDSNNRFIRQYYARSHYWYNEGYVIDLIVMGTNPTLGDTWQPILSPGASYTVTDAMKPNCTVWPVPVKELTVTHTNGAR